MHPFSIDRLLKQSGYICNYIIQIIAYFGIHRFSGFRLFRDFLWGQLHFLGLDSYFYMQLSSAHLFRLRRHSFTTTPSRWASFQR